MDRRHLLKRLGLSAGAISLPFAYAGGASGQEAKPPDVTPRHLPPLTITDVKTILTAPAGIRLVVVKVLTNEPGLYGLGCATFTQRAKVVKTAVDEFLRPFLIGKNPLAIEDVWQSCYVSSYWRNGPVLGNALSGVDMALWDILGKRAGMPVFQLLGGKCRNAVDTYRHASGTSLKEVEDAVRKAMEAGFRHVRAQVSVEGQATYGAGTSATKGTSETERARTETWEPRQYTRLVPKMFEHLRVQLGDDVELLHDTHERIPPILAMQLCRDLEPLQTVFSRRSIQP